MAIEIPTNTALYIPVGPFLDKADGITPELSITVANSAITLIAGAADETAPTVVLDSVAGNNATNTLVHITDEDAGMYYLKLTAANNNRYGKGTLVIEDTATYVTVFHEIQWVSVPYYNWKYGTTLPNVNVTQISGDSDAADYLEDVFDDATSIGNMKAFFDGTGYAGGTAKLQVDLTKVLGTALTETSAGYLAAALVKLLDVASPQLTAASKDQTGDSYAIINGDHGLVSIQDDIDAILADTNELQGDWVDGGRLDLLLDDAASAGDPWTTTLPGAYGAGTAGKIVGDYVNSSLAAIKTVVDTIPSADDVVAAMEANGTKLDHLWEMTEDDGGTRRLTANALEEAPSGTGLDAAGVRAAIGMADADLDTQLAALPTAAENADAVWDEALSGHAGAGTAGAGLSAAGSAGDPWSTLLPGAYGAGTAGYLIGNLAPAGGSVWTYTVTLPDGTTPVADVIVRVCTDIAGTNVIRSGVTNSSGIATFYLQPGTYYIFCEKDGYNFSTYDTEVVS